jgi:hypothetical protein
VTGGKMEGVSGPGVGSVIRVMHAGWVGTMIFVGSTKLGSGVGVLGVEHADIKRIRNKKEERFLNLNVFMID